MKQIQLVKGDKKFYSEAISVLNQYAYLMKNPQLRLQNNFKKLQGYMIFCGIVLAVLVVMTIAWGASALMITALVLLSVVILLSFALWFKLDRVRRMYLADKRPSILELDENGVTMKRENSDSVQMSWNNVAFIRVFNECVCFFAKEGSGFVICVNKIHKDEIFAYLQEHQIHVQGIE